MAHLWQRIHQRFFTIDGIPQVVELNGKPGDVYFTNMTVLHALAQYKH